MCDSVTGWKLKGMTDNHSQATFTRTDSASTGWQPGASSERITGFKSSICPIDQDLVLYFRDGRKQPIDQLYGAGMSISDATGSVGFEVRGSYADGSEFAIPQEQLRAVIDRKVCKAVPIPLISPDSLKEAGR
jgi:hypothetical protein